MRELLQVIGEVSGAVELDQPTYERTDDDVQFDELAHGPHSAGRSNNKKGRVMRLGPERGQFDSTC